MIQQMLALLISGSSAFSKTSLNIWKFTVHLLVKSGLKNFEYYFASMWGEWNCAVVWTFFGIAFLKDWNENWPFPVLWPLPEFSIFAGILSAALSQHPLLGFEIVHLEFSFFLYDPINVGNLISGSSAFSKPSLYIWKFPVHIQLKSCLKDFAPAPA